MQVIGVADSSRRPSGGQTCLVGLLRYRYDHSYFISDGLTEIKDYTG